MSFPAPSELLEGLTDAQRRAVTSDAAPLCVLAGAGSGKTRVLTRRIAYRIASGSADGQHVLALTFTRKAAGEIAGRLGAVGLRDAPTSGTFHAVAAAQLRRWWADRGQRPPVILERMARVVGPLVAARPAFAGVPLGEVIGDLQWARARQLPLGELAGAAHAAGRRLVVPGSDLAALMERYHNEKVRRGLADFDDLLERLAGAIETDATFAAAQRWRWRHVFVDEYQDLNPLQHRLLLAWLGDSADLCVVGDPNQAIYGWNGADPGLLADLPRRWPDAEVVSLDTNHRCTPEVVAAAAAVLGAGSSGSSGAPLRSSRPAGPPVTVTAWPSDEAEASGVAAGLLEGHGLGRAWASLAVLVRTNAQAVRIAERCRAAGVPVRVPGQAGLLDHPAARLALGDLRTRPQAPLATAAADLSEPWALQPPPPPGAHDPDAADVLAVLADLARSAAHSDPHLTVGSWLATLPATLADTDAGGGAGRVTICSFHRAKGLEWDAVWVCGLEEGLVPIGRAQAPAALEEERRLLYVALTRAGRELHCSWAHRRTFGSASVPRRPSPWLDDLLAACGPPAGGAGPDQPSVEEWRRRVALQRDKLRAARRPTPGLADGAEPPDGRVLDALRSWRATQARASAVPAHVVLHDTVLVALASARPVDEAGLLRIPGLGPVKASRYGEALLSVVTSRVPA